MSFELPIPKTRKEYFMAVAAGGTPGTDFPERTLQPKTVEEAYYADLANVDVSTALSKMHVKSRKDQYLNAMINAADEGDDSK